MVGERFVRGVQTAIEQKVPFICITSTGGARMRKACCPMQMAKTTAMIARLADRAAVYQRARGSNDGRRVGELCVHGRRRER